MANASRGPGGDEGATLAPDGRPMEGQPQWRKDFPIDLPDDEYVSRREFSKFLTVVFITGHKYTQGQ